MTKQGSTGQMQQKPQQLQACRASASPGEQQQRWEWGSILWRMGTIQSQQWGAGSQAVLGQKGSRPGNVSQEEGQAACKAHSKHLTLKPVLTEGHNLSIVLCAQQCSRDAPV